MRADLSGQTLAGRYKLVRCVGAGGMGAVYEARTLPLGRRVALKVLRQAIADRELEERFRREAQILASLENVHIVQVIDFGVDSAGIAFIVMDYLEGASLGSILGRGPISPRRMATLAIQALAGLGAAHDAGVVHRDVKPDNIFVVPSPTMGEMVKLLDFGVAKVVRADAQNAALTREGRIVGTIRYMSPEQVAGEPLDGRTDLYSLGMCMYRACGGHLPFEEDASAQGVLKAILRAKVAPLSGPGVDPAFAEIVHRALNRDRDGRFASAEEMGAVLQRYLGRSASGPSPTVTTVDHAPPTIGPLSQAPRPTATAPTVVPPTAPGPPVGTRAGRAYLVGAVTATLLALCGGALAWSAYYRAPVHRALSSPTRAAAPLRGEATSAVAPPLLDQRHAPPSATPRGSNAIPPQPTASGCTSDGECPNGARCARKHVCECPIDAALVCSGTCTSLRSHDNCGACGTRCAVDEACSWDRSRYACTPCAKLFTRGASCGGACVDLDSSDAHCGGCARACRDGEHCRAGVCRKTVELHETCATRDDCRDLSASCTAGTCVCEAPRYECRGHCGLTPCSK